MFMYQANNSSNMYIQQSIRLSRSSNTSVAVNRRRLLDILCDNDDVFMLPISDLVCRLYRYFSHNCSTIDESIANIIKELCHMRDGYAETFLDKNQIERLLIELTES